MRSPCGGSWPPSAARRPGAQRQRTTLTSNRAPWPMSSPPRSPPTGARSTRRTRCIWSCQPAASSLSLRPRSRRGMSRTSRRWCTSIISTACRSSACRTTMSCNGATLTTNARIAQCAEDPRRGILAHGEGARLQRAAGPGHLRAGSRICRRLSGGARPAHAYRVARALLRDGRRGPRQ